MGDASTGDADASGGDASGDAASCIAPATPARVVFLNSGGGTYTPGAADSRTNKTPLVSTAETATAWTISSASWKTLRDCVEQKFAPFNITVTEVDPGASAEHIEIVFAQASLPALAGTSFIAPLTCAVVPNGVAFVSQAYADANPTNGCAAVAAAVGYTLGLESVVACPDAMSFTQTSCASTGFTNVALQCGTSTAVACQCGGAGITQQNSYARMMSIVGPRCL